MGTRMKRTTTEPSRVQEMAEEHAVIRTTMQRIHGALDRLLAYPARSGEEWELPALLRSFREHLKRHFEQEESRGLLGDAREYYDPGTQRQVETLVSEHRDFERRVTRILDEVDGGFVPPAIVQSCHDRELRKLLADLARHETVENALLQALICRQAGGGDRRPLPNSPSH